MLAPQLVGDQRRYNETLQPKVRSGLLALICAGGPTLAGALVCGRR
jgi:hypothetical protein